MSKKNRRKRRKSKHRAPNISPLTLLRPRLDALLGDEAFAEKDSQAIKADLDALFEGLKTYDSLPVLIRAYHSAGGQAQDRLDEIVPGWLDERGYAEPLLTLLERYNIYEEGRERAVAWLKAAGVDPLSSRRWNSRAISIGPTRIPTIPRARSSSSGIRTTGGEMSGG